MLRPALLLGFSVLAGYMASLAQIPAAWMIGPMVVSLLYSVLSENRTSLRVPKFAFSGAQMVIGVLIAGTFRTSDMPLLFTHWYAVILVSIGTLMMSVGIGYILDRKQLMDRSTAFLGVMPGGASGMVAMSGAMEADPKIVALMQYVRLITVILSASLVTKWLAGSASSGHGGVLSTAPHATLDAMLLSLVIGAAGAFVGIRIRLPAGAMLGAMAFDLVANLSGWVTVVIQPALAATAYVVLGIYVGLLFDRTSVRHAGRLLPTIVVSTIALIVASALIGWVLALLTPESFLTWFLATSPGGLDSITLMALGTGANVALIVSLQTVRLFFIVFFGPLVVRRLHVPSPRENAG